MMKFVAAFAAVVIVAMGVLMVVRRDALSGLPFITERPKRKARSRRSGRRRSSTSPSRSTTS